MADSPNFTKGTQGEDELRSPTTEVLTRQPRAAIRPDLVYDQYSLSRTKANNNIVAEPYTDRWYSTKQNYTIRFYSSTMSDYNLIKIQFNWFSSRFSVKTQFEFDTSTIEVAGYAADESANPHVTPVGLNGNVSAVDVAAAFLDAFRNYTSRYDATGYTASRNSTEINISVNVPPVVSFGQNPYISFPWAEIIYDVGGQNLTSGVSSGGEARIAKNDLTQTEAVIQPPFSLTSRILRGT